MSRERRRKAAIRKQQGLDPISENYRSQHGMKGIIPRLIQRNVFDVILAKPETLRAAGWGVVK